MARRRAWGGALLCLLALAFAGTAIAQEPQTPAERAEGDVDVPQAQDGEEAELRERLTEREDKRRPLEPWTTEIAGFPLTVSGEYEIELGALRRRVFGAHVQQPDRLLLEQHLEVEAFYTFGAPLSLFVQAAAVMEKDLLDDTPDEHSELFVERGEMWLFSENIAGSGVSIDAGRLDFEDDRRWWWDDELDALRVAWEGESFEVTLALARELLPDRSDEDEVDPEQERVLRWIGEISWDWSETQALELFLLHQRDRSPTQHVDDVVRTDREDDSDARLTWLGARASGVVPLRTRGIFGYWLDTALVRGKEWSLGFEEISGRRSVVDERVRRDVRGYAADAGVSWMLEQPWEPRLFASAAYGTGDSRPDSGADRSFRQTELHANEAGFGGVERFPHYGVLLDPELSNLCVLTLGAGLSVLRSSSLDLVLHGYWQPEPSASLPDSRLDATLNGERHRLGEEIDLVLAVEEWERFELAFFAAAFHAGPAFEGERAWSYGAFAAARLAY